ncbi:ABC transporter ATP-binding protein [Pseudoalteromonas sp. MMG007]|uniref:ABC transporter ATP-binding protein n=1 Tax=Pseudoalteromonas sp. MMG007 TaxID=2822684 RepID=UPI001B36C13D|nr:ABC transporter ATP-binding protein [Pseudoalteromonas sp. MMG007]MBQ4859990.1 ABC transporter ATP-binding protein [Pseudoalteromonas sp. MMG007]
MTKAIIHMENISKSFRTGEIETEALKSVNFKIMQGDYISITGPSGCGKSTLLSILGLLDSPTAGKYFIDGEDVSKLTATESANVRNKKIGFVFQSFNLIDEINVFENVALPLTYNKAVRDETYIQERVKECLDIVDMSHRIFHKPNQLSGGQQQRIAIARALVNKPSILLVDEPTGNLDSKSGDKVFETLELLNKGGTTVCMVTHDPRYADRAHTILTLKDGELVKNGEIGVVA